MNKRSNRNILLMTTICVALSMISVVNCKKLLLVSFDGFRWDYLKMYPQETFYFRQLIQRSVFVEQMKTTFVTLTFPSHWTLATGLYEESHGIVGNKMYDPVFNETFGFGTRQEKWWNDSLPIWITARKAGLKTGTFFWPGSEVPFEGLRAHYYYEYDGKVSFGSRVDTVVDWFANDNVTFATLYFNEPDSAGHYQGPNTTQMRSKLAEVNSYLAYLFHQFEEKDLLNVVDVIITSDHGMTEVDRNKVVNFNNTYAHLIDQVITRGPVLAMFAKPGKADQLVREMQNVTEANKLPLKVYSRETVPSHFHFSKHRRIPDVVAIANENYYLLDRNLGISLKATHGWSNDYSEMAVPFIAVGPSFRRGRKVSGLRQVDVYGIMCHLLNLEGNKHNGSSALYDQIFVSDKGSGTHSVSVSCVMVNWIVTVLLMANVVNSST